MRIVNYIDLGAHTGEEIDIVLKDYKSNNNVDLRIYGIEADSHWSEQLVYRYSDFNEVKIFNYAISNSNEPIKLYLESKRLGSSIFSTKRNVSAEYLEVQGIPITDFIIKNIPDFKESFNVLKLNIEGAELMVYRNLIANDMLKYIDVFCGHPSHDILKVSELSNYVDEYFSIIKDNSIDIKYLCGEVNTEKSINIFNEIV
jgi:FkbM family methyltransferase